MDKAFGGIDYSELLKIANSPAGQELMALVQKNKDAHFDEAMREAEAGDFAQAQAVITQMLSSKEGQELIKKIRGGQ